MSDLISRQELLESIEKVSVKGLVLDDDWVHRFVQEFPSIDAVKHGIWIEENTRTRSSKFYCSVCHRTAYDPQPTRIAGWVKRCRYAYCPNCGARMDEGDNHETN